MSRTTDNNELGNIRIANFSQLELSFKNVLNFNSTDIQNIYNEIRRYADLPYVYILSVDQAKTIFELLMKLKSIRSTCYPYALFLIGDSGHGSNELLSAEIDLDVIRLNNHSPEVYNRKIKDYAASKFTFDRSRLKIENTNSIPDTVDVVIVGAGIKETSLAAYGRIMPTQPLKLIPQKLVTD